MAYQSLAKALPKPCQSLLYTYTATHHGLPCKQARGNTVDAVMEIHRLINFLRKNRAVVTGSTLLYLPMLTMATSIFKTFDAANSNTELFGEWALEIKHLNTGEFAFEKLLEK